MTPFGRKIREMRREKGVTLTEMAEALEVSAAYLSALEHGKRGRPSLLLQHQICAYFNIIWDEAEALQRLARLSHPRATVDTAGLSPEATELANLLAERIREMPDDVIRGVYSNQMVVSHTREEFLMDFVNMFPPQGVVTARLIVSPGHLKRMIRALSENLSRYEAKHGQVSEAPAPPADPYPN